MDGDEAVDRMLKNAGAELIREGKHLVYRLPNGHNFVRAKTPSDYRIGQNNLRDLRRAMNIPRAEFNRQLYPEKGERKIVEPQPATMEPVQAKPLPTAMPTVMPEPSAPKPAETYRDRLLKVLEQKELHRKALLDEASREESAIAALSLLLDVDDSILGNALQSLLPKPAPAPVFRSHEPAPPDFVTDRVHVTQQLVFAATQVTESSFTLDEIVEIMIGGRRVNGDERARIRSCVDTLLRTLVQKGKVLKIRQGKGRMPGLYQKIAIAPGTHERI